MTATAEGVFRIIDRASPALRGIERQAIKTDLAIEKLGADLDMIGTRKQLRGLEDTERRVRVLGTTVENTNTRASKSFRRLDKDLVNQESRWKRLRRGIGDVGKEIFKLVMTGGKLSLLATGIGVVVQGVGALSGGVIALVPRLTDLGAAAAPAIAGITGIGLAALTTHMAVSTLTGALQHNARAIRGLGPEGRKLMMNIHQARPLMNQIRRSSNQGIFAGLNSGIGQLGKAAPTINRVLGQMSGTIGGLISSGAKRFTSRSFLGDFENIAGQGSTAIDSMGRGIFNLISAFRHVAVAAKPFTDWISQSVVLWTRHFNATMKASRASGELATKFDRARVSLKLLGHFVHDVWGVLKVLGKAARPLGDDLWHSANRAMDGWLKFHQTVAGRQGLMQEFAQMGVGIKAIMGLVGKLGAAIFHVGATPGLANTANSLSKLVPSLEHLLTKLAAMGPAAAGALTALGGVLGDLGTSPVKTFLNAITMTLHALDSILRASGPLKSVLGEVFGTLLISRYLVKLGLLEKGWWRVAFAAKGAADAEMAASGAGMGGGGGILGPVLRRGGARRIGFLGRIGMRRGFRSGAVGSRFIVGSGGAAATEDLAAGGTMFGAAGARGLALGAGMGLARLGLGVASKFILPLAAISALFGGITAGRSGSFGHQVGQTAFGAANASTFGLLGKVGGLGNFFATPAAKAAKYVGGDQNAVARDLANADRGRNGLGRLAAELAVLKRHADDIQYQREQASKDYLTQLRQEIASRQQLINQLKTEANLRGGKQASNYLSALNKVAGKIGFHAADVLGIQHVNSITGTGPEAAGRRGGILRGLLRNAGLHGSPGELAYMTGAAKGIYAAHGHGNYQIGMGGRVFTGGRTEVARLLATMQLPAEVLGEKKAALTPAQNGLVLELMARGYGAPQARAVVREFEGNYSSGVFRKTLGFAGGGRIPGHGLADTVPVGGMAAPGELIVNRHTEARANSMLAPFGATLGGLVGREGRRHSDSFAKGGRATWRGFDAPHTGIENVGNAVLSKFPGLAVTSTLRGKHANGSYHGLGEAIDVAGSNSTMNQAGRWIASHLGGQLLEGIHNNTLSIKNGRRVPGSFWGSSTWAAHRNHIHLAAADSASGIATGAANGSGAGNVSTGSGTVNLGFNDPGGLAGFGGIKVHNFAANSEGAATGATNTGVLPSGGDSAQNMSLGHKMLLDDGFSDAQWPSLQKLWSGESNWRTKAKNKKSGAYGIPQALPASKMASAGADWATNPATQIKWGLNYISGRYGSPQQALAAWNSRSPHWYGKGGRTPKWGGWYGGGGSFVANSPTMIGVGDGGPERVTVSKGKGGHGGSLVQATFYIQSQDPEGVRREVEAALARFADALDRESFEGADLVA